jgi:hypothetical protein
LLPCLVTEKDKKLPLILFYFIFLQILKQLEKESIKWTEVDDGGAIMIRVDVINPKRLSFSKK